MQHREPHPQPISWDRTWGKIISEKECAAEIGTKLYINYTFLLNDIFLFNYTCARVVFGERALANTTTLRLASYSSFLQVTQSETPIVMS